MLLSSYYFVYINNCRLCCGLLDRGSQRFNTPDVHWILVSFVICLPRLNVAGPSSVKNPLNWQGFISEIIRVDEENKNDFKVTILRHTYMLHKKKMCFQNKKEFNANNLHAAVPKGTTIKLL